MKRLLLSLAILVAGMANATAQTPEPPRSVNDVVGRPVTVDLDKIREETAPEGVYAALAAKFAAANFVDSNGEIDFAVVADSTWVLLYYGAASQPFYKGSADYWSSPLKNLMEQGKFEQAWQAGTEYVKENPTSLFTYQGLLECGSRLKRPREELMQLLGRTLALSCAIMRSGDGRTQETAYKVLAVSDEYHILRNVFYVDQILGQKMVPDAGRNYDIMSVKWEGDRLDIWFDVTLPFAQFGKMAVIQNEREDAAMKDAIGAKRKNGKKKRN